MLLLGIYILAPIAWIVMMSFKSKIDVISSPSEIFFTPTLDNYLALFGVGKVGLLTGSTFLPSSKTA